MRHKHIYILIFIVIVVGIFQQLRVRNVESYFKIVQKYNFNLPKGIDGKLHIEKPQKYLILYSNEKNGTDDIKNGIEQVFNFSNVKYDSLRIDTAEKIDFSRYSMIILVAENYGGLRKYNYLNILEFVKNGGDLFITERSQKNPFNKIAGIEQVGEFIETDSFSFTKPIFPGFIKTAPGAEIFGSSGLDLKLNWDNLEVLAVNKKGNPLMWIKKYGKGDVFYNNTTLFQGKIFRGVMKQLIAYMSDFSFFPVINAKVLHIDDYPSPIPVVENKILRKEYGMDTNGFFNLIWWKDMLGIYERQKLIPTGLLIAEYNDATVKNKIVPVQKRTLGDLSKRGRQLKAIGGEIAMHGYNHYSLGLKNEINYSKYGYTPWGSIEEMVQALEIAKKTMADLYGKDLGVYTYIAPSNLLPKSGKKAVLKVFPEVNSFCGIFYGEQEPGILIQEVGRDVDYPNIYALPRMSSGFFYTGTILWQIYNGIAAYGYLSHFIHPDDVMDTKRGGGQTWESLEFTFENIFKHINENYSVLKPEIQSEMTFDYMKIEKLGVEAEKTGDTVKINIKNFRGSFDAQFRLKGEDIKSIKGATYTLIEETKEYTLYLLTVKEPEIIIKTEKLEK